MTIEIIGKVHITLKTTFLLFPKKLFENVYGKGEFTNGFIFQKLRSNITSLTLHFREKKFQYFIFIFFFFCKEFKEKFNKEEKEKSAILSLQCHQKLQ